LFFYKTISSIYSSRRRTEIFRFRKYEIKVNFKVFLIVDASPEKMILPFLPSISEMALTRPDPGSVARHTTFSSNGNCNISKINVD
jgi:hypothetical protein